MAETTQKNTLVAWAEGHPFLTAMVLGVLSSATASVLLHRYFWKASSAGLAGACTKVRRKGRARK